MRLEDLPHETREQFASLLGREDEELLPQLRRRLRTSRNGWPSVKHPYVISVCHTDIFNHHVNQQYLARRAAIAEAKAEGDWSSYVYMHEKPWRINAFRMIMHKLDDGQFWEMLGDLWIESENIEEQPELWWSLLESGRPYRTRLMEYEEVEALQTMPDRIEVWQGHTDRRNDGYSWTTKLETALWFAGRFAAMEGAKPMVTGGHVKKEDVIAYFARRNESEIIVHPFYVIGRETKRPDQWR